MKDIKIEAFYSPLCPDCPKAIGITREVAEEYGIELFEINVLSPNGQKKAEERNVKSIPSILIGETKIMGIPTKEQLKKALEKELEML